MVKILLDAESALIQKVFNNTPHASQRCAPWGVTFFGGPIVVKFSKPQTTVSDHVARLKGRGMSFANEDSAKHHISQIGYYRLTAYWLPYEADHDTHEFHANTSFEDVLGHYIFDRNLRLLMMDAIERVEISMRTKWVYELVDANGPHAHLDSSLFKNKANPEGRLIWDHQKGIDDLIEEFQRSREIWVRHFKNKYDEPLPPLWASCELMTLGAFSKWYKYTASSGLRNKVARSYGLDETVLISFLHHVSVVRNICAHHTRLWNRNFTLTFRLPRRPRGLGMSLNNQDSRKIFNTLTVLAYLTDRISPDSRWKSRVLSCIDGHKIDTTQMGFSEGYRTDPIWAAGVN